MITREFKGRVLRSMGSDVDLEIDMTLSYDEDYDPYAVQVILSAPDEEDVVWTVGRDLMVIGVRSLFPCGGGDVKFRYLGTNDGGLLMCLKNLTGHADIWLPQGEVVDFLNEATEAVPLGMENVDSLLDEALEEILNS